MKKTASQLKRMGLSQGIMKAGLQVSSPEEFRRSPHLERDKVVAAALDLLNEGGFEGLTLRRLADELGVKAAALYWHFKNKQDLVDQVAARILTDNAVPWPSIDPPWREIMTRIAYRSRSAFMRYRDGALVVANADLAHTMSGEWRDELVRRLTAQGIRPQQAGVAIYTIGRYTLGCVIEEQSDPNAESRESTAEERFADGLEIILEGIAHSIAQNTSTPD